MAWNEPGGSNKGSWEPDKNNGDQGPPDLDELIKKLQSRFGGLLRGGSSGGGSGGNSGLNGKSAGLIALIILLVWALFGFYTIQPAERGVEMVFGAYKKTETQGLNWNFPYPVGHVEKVNVEEVRSINHLALMLTQDENIVKVELEVQYVLKEAESYLFNVSAPDNTLRQATESALREIVGTSKMDDVLTSGRTKAAAQTKELIQDILDRYKTGLLVRSVNMQNAQPPEEVQEAFADVIKAREDEERHKNTAQAYANEVVQKAGGAADQMREEANAYKAQVIAHAEGETKRFISVMNEYEKAPEVTRQRLYLETMEAVLSGATKVMIDVKGGNNLMYLPLDKIIERAPEAVAPSPSTSVYPQALPRTNQPAMAEPLGRDDSRSGRRTR